MESKTARFRPWDPGEREKIIEALKSGDGVNQVARTFKRGAATISGIAKEQGIQTSSQQTAKATEARKAYDVLGRIGILNKALDRAAEILAKSDIKPDGFHKVALAICSLLDRRKAEDEPEQSAGKGALQELLVRIRAEADEARQDAP